MWTLKVLTGPQAGQTFQVREGAHVIGRSAECDVSLNSKGISKEHARLTLAGPTLTIQDLQSSNGTFVNGLRIRQQVLKSGDKVGFFDVLVDVTTTSQQTRAQTPSHVPVIPSANMQMAQPSYDGNLAMWQNPTANQQPEGQSSEPVFAPKTLQESIEHYVENVAMPGVYKLAQSTEYRWVIGCFILIYALLVTGFSVIPTVEITRTSIEHEGQRRALTIANALADRYKRSLQDGTSSAFSTRSAEVEEGVQVALIISAQDGHILAPANKIGSYEDLPFINKARKQDGKVVEQVDGKTVGASVPISTFKSEADGYAPSAYAVILYNVEAFSANDGRLISLVVRVLTLSILFGGLIFLLLYKVVEHPLRDLNFKIDEAIRSRKDNIETPYDFEILKKLVLNVNTLLGRALNGASTDGRPSVFQDRQSEAVNLVQIIRSPSIAINGQNQILHVNSAFEDLTGMRIATLQNQLVESLTDQALQLSIRDLIERCRREPHLIATNDLDMSGQMYEIDAQAVLGATDIEYFVLTLALKGGGA